MLNGGDFSTVNVVPGARGIIKRKQKYVIFEKVKKI